MDIHQHIDQDLAIYKSFSGDAFFLPARRAKRQKHEKHCGYAKVSGHYLMALKR
jgi:hypothetical protein